MNSSGDHIGLSDRSQIIRPDFQSTARSVTATILPSGAVWGFVMEMVGTRPDSVPAAKDIAALQKMMNGSGTYTNRALDSAQQSRVRSLINYMRRRCP